jgi:CBS domain-containing protein
MKIEELMTKDVVCIEPTTSLNDAAHQMWIHDCGALPVVHDQQTHELAGMITDRDICMAAYMRGKSLKELQASDALSRDVVACSPSDDVARARDLMRRAQVRRIPVTDDRRRVVGIVTLAQLARAASDGRAAPVSQQEVGDTLAAISAKSQPVHASALSR